MDNLILVQRCMDSVNNFAHNNYRHSDASLANTNVIMHSNWTARVVVMSPGSSRGSVPITNAVLYERNPTILPRLPQSSGDQLRLSPWWRLCDNGKG